MKFTVASNELATLLQNVGRLVPSSNPNIPALANYLFEVSPERISVKGGDTSMRMTGSIAPLSCEGEERFLVAPSPLVEYIKSLPAQPLTFDVETRDQIRIMRVSHQSGFIDIPLGDSDLYIAEPERGHMPEDDLLTVVSLNTSHLLQGIAATQQAAHQDPLYSHLHGIRFVIKSDRMEMCGTDTVQLIRYLDYDARQVQDSDHETTTSLVEPAFTLPLKLASTLVAILPSFVNEEALVTYRHDKVFFRFGAYHVETNIKTDSYPDYNSVIPTEMDYSLDMDSKVLLRAAGRVNQLSAVASMASDSNLIILTFAQGVLTLTGGFYSDGANALGANVEETIPVDYPTAMEGMRIVFMANIFLKFLKSFDSDTLSLHFTSPSQAILVTPAKMPDQVDLRGIFMPVRL